MLPISTTTTVDPVGFDQQRTKTIGHTFSTVNNKTGVSLAMMTPTIFITHLDNNDIELINKAVEKLRESAGDDGIDSKILSSIDQTTFDLGELGLKLRNASKKLHTEAPVIVIKGLDLTNKPNSERLAIQAGIGSYIGNLRASQTGNAVSRRYVNMHVTEVNKKDGFIASAITNSAMPFHSDSGDIVSICYWNNTCMGRIHVAAGAQVYKELCVSRPDVIKTLSEDWEWDIPGNVPDVVYRPLLNITLDKEGRRQITLQSERRPFLGDATLPRKESLKEISEEQKEALQAIQHTCENVAVTFTPETNDFVFLNNRAILHARDAYTAKSGRHAVRMVHRDEEHGWGIPKSLAQQYHTMYQGFLKTPRLEDWQPIPRAWGNYAQHG